MSKAISFFLLTGSPPKRICPQKKLAYFRCFENVRFEPESNTKIERKQIIYASTVEILKKKIDALKFRAGNTGI